MFSVRVPEYIFHIFFNYFCKWFYHRLFLLFSPTKNLFSFKYQNETKTFPTVIIIVRRTVANSNTSNGSGGCFLSRYPLSLTIALFQPVSASRVRIRHSFSATAAAAATPVSMEPFKSIIDRCRGCVSCTFLVYVRERGQIKPE